MHSRVIKTNQQPADNSYALRRCQRKIPKNEYFLHSEQPQESPQHSPAAIMATEDECTIQESGAEQYLTTTNMVSGVEEIVLEFDADSIAYCLDSATPMDPMREMPEIVRQMLEDNKAECDHHKAERERLKSEIH